MPMFRHLLSKIFAEFLVAGLIYAYKHCEKFREAVNNAFSFVNKSLDSWTINVGIPIRYLKQRNKNILTLSKRFEDNE